MKLEWIRKGVHLLALSAGLGMAASAPGEDSAASREIAKYRDMLKDGNPAELLEMQGETLWKKPRGAKNATLERCDLGLGAGVVEGAYAQLPRYFADTGKVQDVESRLVTCMQTLQGLSLEQATHGWYKPGSDMEALVTFVATQSHGASIDVPARHASEAAMYAIGEGLFQRRSGPLDFACATCHSQEAKRIRLQELPNLMTTEGARQSMAEWPAYRVSQGAVWGMERRLIDCLRQMRLPDADFTSEAIIALQVYLQKNASGAKLNAPGIKR
ncbi:MAG: sulfur oxidation c-type cytochrome SoxA [Burkholderiales bacterium]